MTLYVGDRGIDLPLEAVISPLNTLIGKAWVDVAGTHRVQLVGETIYTDPTGIVQMIMQPRTSNGLPLTTDTDVVEAAVGVLYYMLMYGCFATIFTFWRPDESGLRTPVGEIHVTKTWSEIHQVISGNASSVSTS